MTISERFVLWTSWLINAYKVLIPFTEEIFCSIMLKNIQRLSKNRPNIPGVILSQKPAMFKSFFFTSLTISQNNVQAFQNCQSIPIGQKLSNPLVCRQLDLAGTKIQKTKTAFHKYETS